MDGAAEQDPQRLCPPPLQGADGAGGTAPSLAPEQGGGAWRSGDGEQPPRDQEAA